MNNNKDRNDVIDCPYKEFSVIKLNQMKKVNDQCTIMKVNMSTTRTKQYIKEFKCFAAKANYQ